MTPKLTEKQFEAQVKDIARLYGWRYYHTWRSIHSPAGFPDCVMVRPHRLIFAELKREDGKLTPDQEGWIEDLIDASIISRESPTLTYPEVYLWRPSDFDSIVEVLKR